MNLGILDSVVFTGKKKILVMINRSAILIPVARCSIKSPVF